ncbi:hypothetical protein [Pseudodesulfovibrio methanolicus]|uniref:Uncharacterized protein n=1 Tax=Pseudodesulfovibrio methanolicus TaxID=3126690 RepID=A0ABZ2IYP2_9BACT
MAFYDELYPSRDVLNDNLADDIATLNENERAFFLSAGERLRRSHDAKKHIVEEFMDSFGERDKEFGVPHEPASVSREEYVEKSVNPEYFVRLAGIKECFAGNENLFAFENAGGLFSWGVCWWHSRFQRAALYLTTYRPGRRRCSDEEAEEIIEAIRYGNRVVEIPGFSNFAAFSEAYQSSIQRCLNIWQFTDGLYLLQWLNGLAGEYETTVDTLHALMEEIYQEVGVKKRIGYVKLQIKGLDAHAWLITEIKKDKEGKVYTFNYIDSNMPTTAFTYTYMYGVKSLYYFSAPHKCVPYLQKKGEVDRCFKRIEAYRSA